MSDRHHNLGVTRSGDASNSAAEAALLAAYRAAADDAQRTIVAMVQSMARGSPRRSPPALALVPAVRHCSKVHTDHERDR